MELKLSLLVVRRMKHFVVFLAVRQNVAGHDLTELHEGLNIHDKRFQKVKDYLTIFKGLYK